MKKLLLLSIWATLGTVQAQQTTPLKYDKLYDRVEYGLIKVERNGKFGFINTKGQLITKYWYDDIEEDRSHDHWMLVDAKDKRPRKRQITSRVIESYGRSYTMHYYDTLARVRRAGGWGLINLAGEEVLPPTYHYIHEFNEGYANVRLDGKLGVIDENLQEIIAPAYTYIGKAYRGFFKVNSKPMSDFLNGAWSLVNRQGKVLTQKQYNNMTNFKEGRLYVRYQENRGYIDTTGREIVPVKYSRVSGFQDGVSIVEPVLNGLYGLVNKQGKEITAIKYHNIKEFSEGLAPASVNGKKYIPATGDWGILNNQGQEITPFKYRKIYGYSQGVAKVMVGGDHLRNHGQWGLINRQGKEITPLKYHEIRLLSQGIAPVRIGDKWGFVDTTGKEITAIKYYKVFSFHQGIGGVSFADEENYFGKIAMINTQGKLLTPFKYSSIEHYHDGRYIVVKVKSKTSGQTNIEKEGVVDSTGKEVIPAKYDAVSKITETAYRIKLKKQWGVMTISGKLIVPIKYAWIHSFQDGIAIVQLDPPDAGLYPDSKYGAYNQNWELVIPPIHKTITRFSKGQATIATEQGWGMIDKQGKLVFTTHYQYMSHIKHGLAKVALHNKWGIIDTKGKELIAPQYDAVRILSSQIVVLKQGDQWMVKQVK
ncbi:MAG TPA: hypothetical protein DCS93_03075 [Microscillaceae bacterium]|nr:hypothetical protein [Microscillaceae bacterium]